MPYWRPLAIVSLAVLGAAYFWNDEKNLQREFKPNLHRAMEICDNHHALWSDTHPPTEAERIMEEQIRADRVKYYAKTGREPPPIWTDTHPDTDSDVFQPGWEICYSVQDKWHNSRDDERHADLHAKFVHRLERHESSVRVEFR